MSKTLNLIKDHSTNPKTWLVIGVGVAGIVIVAGTLRNRKKKMMLTREDFGAFMERFELLPSPQPPPTAARLPLSGLTFTVKDIFEVEGYVSSFGNPDWQRTHEPAEKTAYAVTALLKGGAKCVGKTVMDEFGFGLTGENKHYGTPVNPEMPAHVPGGSSSGSAVSVAAGLVDFALGTDTTGCVRIPASFCGILGFKPSHGAVSTVGVIPNSQSLDVIGWYARDPSVLQRVGQVLLKVNTVESRRMKRVVFADDLFELSMVPKQKTVYVVSKAIEQLSGYQPSSYVNLCQYIASNVPSLKGFFPDSMSSQHATVALKTLSSVMASLQRYEFKTNHEEWFQQVKPKLGPFVSDHVKLALKTIHDDTKSLYKVRTEMRAAVQCLLKDGGILVMPTVADPFFLAKSGKVSRSEFHDQASALSSIASVSGCCQVIVPLGKHDDCPISVSLTTYHGGDNFLLDTLLDIYSSLLLQVSSVSNSLPLPDENGNLDASELLKEKGNAAFKGRQWNKAVAYYSEAIKLNGSSATYYSNRAAAYLELACYQKAEEDCNKAITLDKKSVKAYLRRGTARESLLQYKEAIKDFRYARVLEPQNKVANQAEKRLRKLAS